MELNSSRATSPRLGTSSRVRRHALAVAAAVVLPSVLAACGSVWGQHPSQAGNQSASGFVGYKWTVTSITYQGKTTVVPAGGDARTGTYLVFTPDGHFGANEPVNYHGGTYTLTPGGFTTHGMYQTLVGSWPPSAETAAISAFTDGTHASAKASGDTLTVSVSGYTMTARRAGRQANFPPPAQTSGPPPQQASAQPGQASASSSPDG